MVSFGGSKIVRHVLTHLLVFAATAFAVRNPILPGWNPDPHILRVEDTYYIAVSSFSVFPGVPIYKSKDLANWELVSHALKEPSSVQLSGISTGNGVWAPSLAYVDGLFYVTSMTYLGSNPLFRNYPRIWWVSSPDLVHWSDPVWADPYGIDPNLFRDPISNKTYLNLMSINNNFDRIWGISQCEVNLSTGRCIGAYHSLWNGTQSPTTETRPEGPKEFYKDGYYYLVLAEGGTSTGHQITIGRSKSPEGPWESAPNNPLIYNGANQNLTIQSTGHGTFTDTPDGKWYVSLLARRNVKDWDPLGREAFLVAVDWEDGWPVLNEGKPLLPGQSIPGAPDQEPRQHFVDNFDGPELDRGWYQIRTPYTMNYRLSEPTRKPGFNEMSGVELIPNVYTLSDRDTPAALLRKATSLNMTFSATLLPTSSGLGPRQSVGISAYLSEHTHQDIGVRGCSNVTDLCLFVDMKQNSLFPEERPKTTEWPLNRTSIPADLTLSIRLQPLTSKLGYSLGGGDPVWTTKFSSEWWSQAPENYSVFEGAMFALFASANGEPWPIDAPNVGFSQVKEEYYEENIPDFNVWS